MPIYEYKCAACQHTFELTLSMKDNDVPKESPCPECKAEGTVDRYFSSAPKTIDAFNAGRVRLNGDFRNKLENIKKFYKNDNINEHGAGR